MKGIVEERAAMLGEYIIESKATVRSTAKKFGVSKSTVHKDVSQRLKVLNPALYRQVREILDTNKSERHIRGGLATKKKYLQKKASESENQLQYGSYTIQNRIFRVYFGYFGTLLFMTCVV